MNKKQIQAEITKRLSNGESKSAVFRLLRGGDVSDRKIAHYIASYADPKLCQRHAKLIKAMVVIAWIQLAFAVFSAFTVGQQMSLFGTIIVVGLISAFAYLFVWGFSRSKAWVYNVSIFLSIVNLPKALKGFAEDPLTSSIAFAVSLVLIAFTWHVRGKLFPDFLFMSPKKINGSYAFSS